MRKRNLALVIGISSAVSYLLIGVKDKSSLMDKIKSIVTRSNNKTEVSTFEKAGVPDQIENEELSQIENSKMVSEGSQYGVQYYNQVLHEEK